jgi:hypothetical protein
LQFVLIPETRAYRVSGLAELFPQNCQIPNLSNTAHLKALAKELQSSSDLAANTHKNWSLIKDLQKEIDVIMNPILEEEQRVDTTQENILLEIVTVAPQTITRIRDAPEIVQTCDPTAKCNLIKTKCIHWHQT